MPSSIPRSAAVSAVVAAALAAGLLAGSTSAAADDSATGTRVHDIQGTTRVSPLVGKQVAGVTGIVTGVRTYGSRGFWIQDPEADANPATSEGLFVFTSSVPTVAVGDAVSVNGTVTEYVPGGLNSGNQSLTQLSKPVITVVSKGNAVPAPVTIAPWSVPDEYTPEGDPAAGGSINGLTLDPETYALDYYESLEGTNVRVGTSRVVGATDPYSELWVTVKPWENRNWRGGTVYGSYESQNTGRLQIQSLTPIAQQPFPKANVGDWLKGTTEGPLDFNQFGGYTLTARTLGTVEDKGLERETTDKQHKNELAVATYNVENLDPTDPQEKFDALAKAVVDNLAAPDILALEEIQDNNGAKNDGTVAADQTVKKFTDAIVAAGGPAYEWRSVDPQNNKDGGEPGGNIRQVFLFNPERVSFTDRAATDETSATAVTGSKGHAALTVSPGRIDPANTAWDSSRKPLAGEFVFRGRTVFVIANHFGSKGGDESIVSHHQPPNRSSEAKRLLQAQAVNAFVKDIVTLEKQADVLVVGDINDFEFSGTTEALTDGDVLYPAVKSLPRSERYSYVYQGNSQVLDQILTSPGVRHFEYDSVHINAEFADQDSDHDPQVVRFRP
ncbi:Putative large secreted protein [Streptomyces venezuelae]|uniref:endonuclease/exonuclease/phosphatase family protein n=1 Tax=Streptomyces gardneri TaxID=66892 RepID=UPI0006BD1901|nr:endonuclease/exonuclease/phosphatase family protein [Streptomyces gardneri]ALO07528.1 Putative large secreted protein [Streptomyces venezuelae]QPK44843.1 endonuclease/exonuclease/phosphatase family protein [Streptomyces gardneri]WRK36156.1 endonuclease/exonuclease/phosphatase family protein [Streptomyces venezuelae]CUM42148.1 putative large secreted protein [Streptomyces venezuelae]